MIDDVDEVRRDVTAKVTERCWFTLQDAVQDGLGACAHERALPRQHLIQDHAERPHVRAAIGFLSAHLFRRHVRQSPEECSGLGDLGFTNQFRDPEVQDLHETVLGKEQVRGLQVPVEDSKTVCFR